MKVKVTFKNPDAVSDAFEDSGCEYMHDWQEYCRKWFEYGEYVTIEIDTVAGTAVVVPVK